MKIQPPCTANSNCDERLIQPSKNYDVQWSDGLALAPLRANCLEGATRVRMLVVVCFSRLAADFEHDQTISHDFGLAAET